MSLMLKYISPVLFMTGAALIGVQQLPICLMEPSHLTMQLPESGLTWLEGEDFDGPCDTVSATDWVRLPTKTFDLFIHTDGPSGSGRFWTVTIGLAGKRQEGPARGLCFMTSTAGWETLQRFKNTPLPWADDLDGNGVPELIVWSSFALSEDGSPGDHGLVAWAYPVDTKGELSIDWKLSRKIARELVTEYRTRVEDQQLQELRNRSAQALEAFVTGTCTMREERGQ